MISNDISRFKFIYGMKEIEVKKECVCQPMNQSNRELAIHRRGDEPARWSAGGTNAYQHRGTAPRARLRARSTDSGASQCVSSMFNLFRSNKIVLPTREPCVFVFSCVE